MTSTTNRKSKEASTPSLGKDEMNLCELPIAKLGRRDKREIIEFTGETVKNGQTIAQEWTVRGVAGIGLPTEFAERVLVALISIAAAERFASRRTDFTVHRVLKMMGLNPNGEHYTDVRKALERLHGVTITGKNSWWDNDKKKYRTIHKGFGLIDNYWLESLADEEDDEDEEAVAGRGGYVIWNQWLWESFQAGYIKNIDTHFYYTLEGTLTRRLYRFLDKRMHYQDSYQIDIFALAARLGMVSYRYPSKVKEKLQPAFDELIARGFLASATFFKKGKFTRVRFRRASGYEQPEVREAPKPLPSPPKYQTQHDALYAQYQTPGTLKEAWTAILKEFELALPTNTYLMLADSALLAVDADQAHIAVNAKYKPWIENRLTRQIKQNLHAYLRTAIETIHFIELSNPKL